ncbi:hypothetical protein [Enterococcus rivorum]|uniref:DUF5082 domain-containing protein n=1 Tax=Enterococcus rivorum TaxID=762845 RepID=A0A1E5KX79_9ENTE|nr:hypothetical protein [Enterococcus rivorum]MBP2099118.1 uncharacterized coiled-coil DUF342 family protein [Enterococcus rivorum]OEH82269.1 hypothetical protein BCR26_13545 [Enterococcus rivorum]
MAKKDKALEKQKIRNRYNPSITSLRSKRDRLVEEIERLKLKQISVEHNIVSFNSQYEEYGTMMDTADKNLKDPKSLKGNFMLNVNENMHLHILDKGFRVKKIMEDCQGRMKDGQKKLEEKIEELQSELNSTMIRIEDEINLMNFELNLVDWG